LNVIAYIDARLEEYNAALAKEDGDSSEKKKKKIKNTLFKSKTLAIKIIDTTGVTQISTSDPDSRQIM
jgi:hypothetical protein